VEKNSVPLKEVLMQERGRARSASFDDIAQHMRSEAKNVRAVCIRESQD
jgi:hypothetical protein